MDTAKHFGLTVGLKKTNMLHQSYPTSKSTTATVKSGMHVSVSTSQSVCPCVSWLVSQSISQSVRVCVYVVGWLVFSMCQCCVYVAGFRLANTKCMSDIELWKKILHPNLVQLREVFTTKAFGDNCKSQSCLIDAV